MLAFAGKFFDSPGLLNAAPAFTVRIKYKKKNKVMKSHTNEELNETKDHFKQQKRLENVANYNTINQSAFNHLFPNLQKEYQISQALSTLLFDLVDINKADVLEKILKS